MTSDAKSLAARAIGIDDADDLAGRIVESTNASVAEPVIAPAVLIPGPPGRDGEQGPPGERGEVGPMPAHRWVGTELQFEQAPGGIWGEAVDLKGDKGDRGRDGVGGGVVVQQSGGFGYFPGGW